MQNDLSALSNPAIPVSGRPTHGDAQRFTEKRTGDSPALESEKTIRFEAALGESGAATLRSASPADSFIRLFQFENIHAAVHRGLALAGGRKVRGQDIRFRTAMTPDGDLIAISGATETRLEAVSQCDTNSKIHTSSPDELIRELAFASDLHKFLISNGSSAFGMSKRPMPSIAHAGSVGSGGRVMDNRQDLRRITDNGDIFSLLRNLSSRELDTLLHVLTPVEKALRTLHETLDRYERDGSSFTALRATGGLPVVQARVLNANAEPGTHTVSVSRLATAHTVRGTYSADAEVAIKDLLDKEFRPLYTEDEYIFTINGISISVSKQDTLNQIVTQINHGEDLNRDGVLNSGDDFYTDEDRNENGRLDGGTTAHGVMASLYDGQLQLTRSTLDTNPITVSDPDGFLEGLGLVHTSERGLLTFANEIHPSQGSRFILDGHTMEAFSNQVDHAIPGVSLTLMQTGESDVAVEITSAADLIEEQVEELVDQYNRAIRVLNNTLSQQLQGMLRHQDHVNRIYWKLRHAAEDDVPGVNATLSNLADAGIHNQNNQGVGFHSQQLDVARNTVNRNTSPLLFRAARTPPSVFNALDEIGIASADDNTLMVDNQRLRKAAETNTVALRDLFRRESDGVLPRLAKAAREAIAPRSGSLAFARRRIEAKGGTTIASQAAKSLQTLQQSQQQAQLFQSTLFRASALENSVGSVISTVA